jgi:hypothetical protein
MTTPTLPNMKLPPRPTMPPRPTVPTAPAAPPRGKVSFGKLSASPGHRILLFGPGGIGKTSAASWAPGKKVAFIDLDESLSRLQGNPTVNWENTIVVDGVRTWAELLSTLDCDGWDDVGTIVIDTVTRAEELAAEHTLKTVPADGGKLVTSVEGYGYGKGFTYVFETFLTLLPRLDRHSREGRHVILVAHDCTTTVPNPAGEDWLRYEPRLQSPSSGKASIRLRTREWADHVLFLGYDVAVSKDGKGKGGGTRTCYCSELPHCMAKSRTIQGDVVVDSGESIWAAVLR